MRQMSILLHDKTVNNNTITIHKCSEQTKNKKYATIQQTTVVNETTLSIHYANKLLHDYLSL